MTVDGTKDVCDDCLAVISISDDPTEPSPSHDCIMLPELAAGYDWEYVFFYADGDWVSNGPIVPKRPNVPFKRQHVVDIYGMVEGENDGASWIMLGKLRNGLFFYITAWCDYTGWGCQEGGQSYVCEDLTTLISFAMTNEDRERMLSTLELLGYKGP